MVVRLLGYILALVIAGVALMAFTLAYLGHGRDFMPLILGIILLGCSIKCLASAQGYGSARCYITGNHQYDNDHVYHSFYGVRVYCNRCKCKVEWV